MNHSNLNPITAKKSLVIQLKQRGDIILTTPVLRALRKYFPASQIDFLSFPMGKALLQGVESIDNHHILDHKKGLLESVRLMRELYREKYDVVLDFMNNPRSALISFLTFAPYRICYPSARSFLYTHIAPPSSNQIYVAEQKVRFLNLLGIKDIDSDISPEIINSQKDIEFAENAWRELELGQGEQLVIAVSPTSVRKNRTWPAFHYVTLVEKLIHRFNAKILWIWGPSEYDYVEDIAKQVSSPTIMIPPTNLTELSALISKCDFFVGNSNGPSHIATANNIPTVVIHGGTYPSNWTCPNGRHDSIAYKQGCKGCEINPCHPDPECCLYKVTPEAVMTKVSHLMEKLGILNGRTSVVK